MTTPTEVYQPFRGGQVEAEINTAKRLNNLENRLDLFKLRLDFLQEAIAGLMERTTDKDLVDWFQTNREKLARLTKQQQ